MNQTFVIPEKEAEFVSNTVQLLLDTKEAIVHVFTRDSGSLKHSSLQQNVDVVSAFSGSMSGPEVTAFKKGLKLIIADAWEQAYEDITGDAI